MDDFRIYFAITGGRLKEYLAGFLKMGLRNFLISFAFRREVFGELDNVFPQADESTLIWDSGAFSAWSKKKEVDIHKYINFTKHIIDEMDFYRVHVVNLDSIPGTPGTTPTAEQVQESAETGSKNADTIIAAGLNPMEVFHQGETIDFLHRMIERHEEPYVGISPANDVSVASRKRWLEEVYGTLQEHYGSAVRTHGFGVTAFEILREYPWTSVDSAAFKISAGYGGVSVFDPEVPKVKVHHFGVSKGSETNRRKLRLVWESIKAYLPESIDSPELFSTSLVCRYLINAHTLLQVQNWVSRRPRRTIFQRTLGDL